MLAILSAPVKMSWFRKRIRPKTAAMEVDHSIEQGFGDSAVTVIPVRNKSESVSDPGVEEGWVEELTRVCVTHLSPDHPCLEYLKEQGLDLGVSMDFERFTGNPSPLGGRRWYVSVTVRGRTGEFLLDTGASHSLVSNKFYSLLSDNHDDFKMKVNACSADGSSLQTFGRTFLPMMLGGKEYVFSPTIAEMNDDGILGLDFTIAVWRDFESTRRETLCEVPL